MKKARRSTSKRSLSIGSFYSPPEAMQSDKGLFMGANVAIHRMIRSFIEFGQLSAVHLLVSEREREATEAYLDSWLGSKHPRAGIPLVHSTRDLLNQESFPDFDVGHSLTGVPDCDIYLRAHILSRPYPITSTNHSISYQAQIPTSFLPQLLFFRSYDSSICTTQTCRDAMEKHFSHIADNFNRAFGTNLRYRGRFDVIPLGVDTETFCPRNKKDVRQKLGIPTDSFVILWFGRFSLTDKGDLIPLIRAFEKVVQRNPKKKLLLLLAGNSQCDGYAEFLSQYILERNLDQSIWFHTDVEPHGPHMLYSAADIFVSPVDNIQETFGITPVEAMASGVPQVVADWNGYKDTVDHGRTGFRVPTYGMKCDDDVSLASGILPWDEPQFILSQATVVDIDAYANYLEIIIRNDALREEMAEASRKRALELYAWPVIIRQHEELWKALLDQTTAEKEPVMREEYLRMKYFDIFRSYPTSILTAKSKFALTQLGKNVIQNKERIISYAGHYATLLDRFLLAAILALWAENEESSLELASVEQLAIKNVSNEPNHLLRHILWLMKHGYIHLDQGVE